MHSRASHHREASRVGSSGLRSLLCVAGLPLAAVLTTYSSPTRPALAVAIDSEHSSGLPPARYCLVWTRSPPLGRWVRLGLPLESAPTALRPALALSPSPTRGPLRPCPPVGGGSLIRSSYQRPSCYINMVPNLVRGATKKEAGFPLRPVGPQACGPTTQPLLPLCRAVRRTHARRGMVRP